MINLNTSLKNRINWNDEIIAAVQETPEDEEGDMGTMISNKIALESVKNIHDYSRNDDIKVSNSFVSGLKDFKWKKIMNDR